MSKDDLRLLSTSGILGYGFPEESLKRGMALKPDLIGCDGGSTDGGPYYLGFEASMLPYSSCKRDTALMLKSAREAKIPLVIGSCGASGGEPHLQFMVNIVKEIASENNLQFKLAIIHAEQEKETLKQKLQQGLITTMELSETTLTADDLDSAERIVGVMGVEPYIKAMEMGADVILAGRSTDAAIFASLPIKEGFDPALAWHAGKMLECGAISAVPAHGGDCIMVTMKDDHYFVEPLNPALCHTTLSVADHALYEEVDPFSLREPGYELDLSKMKYEQHTDRSVKISGAICSKVKYRVKLESVQKIGYRTISVVGVRCPILIKQIHSYLESVRLTTVEKINDTYYGKIKKADYTIDFRVFGINAIMGEMEPVKETKSHELCIIIDVVAGDAEISKTVCTTARIFAVHHDFPGRVTTAGNVAVAFSPAEIPVGSAYKFNDALLVEVDDPCEMFKIELIAL